MNSVKGVIKELEGVIEGHLREIDKIKDVIENLRDIFCIETIEKNKIPKALKDDLKNTAPKKRKTTRSGKKNPFSKYKGVYKGMPLADGTPRFRACAWLDGKNKDFGQYAIEEEAAAVAAKARGDMESYRELMALVDQTKEAPDRPKGVRGPRHKAQKPTSQKRYETYYECRHCHLETRAKPLRCIGCNSAGFDRKKREIV